MTLPLPVLPALNLFSETIIGYDVSAEYDDNDDYIKIVEPDRNIIGSKQPSTPEELEILPIGDVGKGAVSIYTTEKLYVADEDPAVTTGPYRQTFIRHEGDVYRVLTEAPWQPHGGHRVYIATRYLERQNV